MAVQFKAGIFQASFAVKIRHPPMPKFYNPGPKNGKTSIINNQFIIKLYFTILIF